MENFEKIKTADLNYLADYIINVKDTNLKEEILKDKVIKERFLTALDDKPFLKLVSSFKDEIKYFLDKEAANLLINNNQISKLEIIMSLDNDYKNNFLSSEIIIDYIYKNYLKFKQNLNGLDYKVADKLAKYIIENKLFICMDRLCSFNDEVTLEVFKNNIEDLTSNINSLPNNFITLFGPYTIEYLLSNKVFAKEFYKYDISKILDLLILGIKLDDSIVGNKKFIENLVNVLDINQYGLFIEYLNKNKCGFVSEIEEQKRKKSDHDINNMKDNLLPDFHNILNLITNSLPKDNQSERDIDKKILKSLPIKNQKEILGIIYTNEFKDIEITKQKLEKYFFRLSEEELLGLIIYLNYKTTVKDFMSEFQFITMQNELINEETNEKRNVIDENRYDTYLTLINFSLLSTKEKVDFYNSFDKNKDYSVIFEKDLNSADQFFHENNHKFSV